MRRAVLGACFLSGLGPRFNSCAASQASGQGEEHRSVFGPQFAEDLQEGALLPPAGREFSNFGSFRLCAHVKEELVKLNSQTLCHSLQECERWDYAPIFQSGNISLG